MSVQCKFETVNDTDLMLVSLADIVNVVNAGAQINEIMYDLDVMTVNIIDITQQLYTIVKGCGLSI